MRVGVSFFVWLLIVSATAHGEVSGISARLSVGIQEFIDQAPGSVSTDESSGDPRATGVPLTSTAAIDSTDLQGLLVGQARGAGMVDDPEISGNQNPEELALEAACYSNSDQVSYLVTVATEETRTIVLSASDLSGNQSGQVESRIFLSGAILVWSTQRTGGFEELSAELNVEVLLDGGLNPVFRAEAGIAGGGGALVELERQTLEARRLSVDDLDRLGLDQASLAVLQRVESEGRLAILMISAQEHAYRYEVIADRPFTLSARLACRLRNVPDGTGVAATLGRPFSELADFIESGLPGLQGRAVQSALNKAMLASTDADNPGPGRAPCGVLGAEILLFFWVPLVWGPRMARTAGAWIRRRP